MTIDQKKNLLTLHNYFRLRMTYAAVVGSYEIHARNAMAVNRLLMVYEDDGRGGRVIRDLDTGRQLPMRTGFLYFVPCNYETGFDITPGISFVSLHFNLDLFYGFDLFENYRHCEMIENPSLVSSTRRLMDCGDEVEILCRVNELIFGFCASLLAGRTVNIQKNIVIWRKYEKILGFIQKSGDATATVEMLADMIGMRKDVFSRTFTRDMGITPKDFLSNTLMRKASEMLLTPGVTVRSVAEQLNFSSEYYFSRFFRKHAGLAPKAFQRFNLVAPQCGACPQPN